MTFTSHVKSVVRHGVIYSGASILAKAVGFIMLPVYAHYLHGEGYGIIGMIDVLLSILVVFAGYGITGATRRIYFQREGERNKKVLISTALFMLFGLVVALTIPGIIFSKQLAWLAFGKDDMGYVITLALLTFIATMTLQNSEGYLLIKKYSMLVSTLSLLRLIVGLSLNIYFIVYLQWGVVGYLYSGLITGWIFTIIVHCIVFAETGYHFCREDAEEILRFILPLIPGMIATFIRDNACRVILRSFLGLAVLGAYEMLFKFATLIGVFVTDPFMKIWGVQRLEVADQTEGPDVIARMFTIHLAVLLFFGLILAVEIPLFLRLLTPEEFWLSGYVVLIAVFSRIFVACYYHLWFGLVYAKKTFEMSKINIWIMFFDVICAYVLIKYYGLFGAVIQGSVSNLLKCVLGFYSGRRYFAIQFEWLRIVKITAFAVLLFFGINSVSVTMVHGLPAWINLNVGPAVEMILNFLRLDLFRDGKLVAYMMKNLPLVLDGCIKFALSFVFLAGLVAGNVIPRQKLLGLCRTRSFAAFFRR